MTTYIVESGNWKLRIVAEDNSDKYSYLEAATRAIEGVFGTRILDENCEITHLLDNKSQDYFDPDTNMEELPPPMFSVVTSIRKENEQSTYVYLTSGLFANASQPINFKLAIQAESLVPDKVKKFKELAEKNVVKHQKKKRSKKKNS